MGVFIIGMHRSGTSMVARILNSLGYYLGEAKDMLPPKPSNPEGFCERLDVVRINNQLLSLAHASWDWPRPLNEKFWNRIDTIPSYEKLVGSTRELLGVLDSHTPWAIKDPRLCLTLPFWRELVPSGKYLICVRNPFEVAQSLSHRHQLTENFGIQLWQVYYENLLKALGENNKNVFIIDYKEVLENKECQIRKLASWLDISASENDISRAIDVVNFGFYNKKVSDYKKRLEQPRYSKIKSIYEFFLKDVVEKVNDGGIIDALKNQRDDLDKVVQNKIQSDLGGRRKVIVHYHIYKNAGSSVDKILDKNFGRTAWVKWEGNGNNASPEALSALITSRTEVIAISSHLADISSPAIDGTDIYPVLFLRHPLDRISSVYNFERRQEKDGPGPNQAKQLDLRSYVEWRLDHDRLFKNYQTMRLAAWFNNPEKRLLPELTRALKALAELPFFGLVERFDESILRLESWLKSEFPGFKCESVRDNATSSSDITLEQKLIILREQLGDSLYSRIEQENGNDLILYDAAMAIWNDRRLS
ncbi:Sulfotransferase family protein [Methylomagnum ishizawai]|uniref:Sulfotransferase family protein n=1 Tax=Methylomagnum ishizawai TaxID=1760988 RepID=A0A1Y6CXG9_9GAMM|nr:sulfotransferase [Methylomagnum ishizawai]SMF95051.1 Sulfotransferase family protein [Methylomagnum ishizawai]